MAFPRRLMEDHRDAYFFWKELGVRGATCLHVDAHLDVSNLRVPQYDLTSPEVNCANFLWHACQEGIVSHLIWVIPPHLRENLPLLEWAQVELQRWMNLSVAEYQSFSSEGSTVVGRLAGARLTICELEAIPAFEAPWLLDIDIDYFLDPEDGVFQTPMQLQRQLPAGSPDALSVAYSVKGGYTPLRQRYLGDLTLLASGGDLQEADRLWALSPELGPPWLRAAGLIRKSSEDHMGAAWEAAADLDPGYRVDPMDVASMYQIRKNQARCALWLEKVGGIPALYLAGFSDFRLGDFTGAARHWQAMLEHPECPQVGFTRSHMLEIYGRARQRTGEPELALQSFREALKFDSRNASLWRELARSQVQLGQLEEAARTYRKSLGLGPDELASLEARLELAELYQSLGQTALAQTECRRIAAGDHPQALKLRALRSLSGRHP